MERQKILTQTYHMDLYVVASALQKSIRRGDFRLAGFMGLELFPNYADYCWRRLLTVSAEDCYGCVTKEIMELCNAFYFVNKGKKSFEYKGRIFISKAILLLCTCPKSRDSDILSNFVHDRKCGLTDEQIEEAMADARKEAMAIPDYVYDCHTIQGKCRGKTKAQFFIEEENALNNPQPSLFDGLDDMFKTMK